MKVGNSFIGGDKELYFIADIGANHDGDIIRAFELIKLAKESGADAAKFQNFQAAKIVSKYGFENLGDALSHQKNWKKSVYEVYEDASISKDWTKLLKEKCDEVGIDYFTSPYDFDSVDSVDRYVDLYKIGSGDITWHEIIEHICKKGKPVLVATGASSLSDVENAMELMQKFTNEIVLMQCNTNYTASIENFKYVNLNVLKLYSKMYPGVLLGLSDHTEGHSTVLGSIALGARVIEKHFTDDNLREGPDHKFAMNPKSWREMVDSSYELFYSLGDGIKRVEDNEKDAAIVQRRSLRAARDISEGEVITDKDIESLRPMPIDALAPFERNKLVGKIAVSNIKKGQHFTLNHIS
jgi:N-acetylneuraminate synthase